MNRDDIIAHALKIAAEYRDQGLTLTLRQLYYQFVARGLLGSGQKIYKRIGAAMTAARLDGRFPIDWIEDRGREAGVTSMRASVDVDVALDRASDEIADLIYHIGHGRWCGQEIVPSVWVEKDALAGVLGPTCTRLGVGLFACKGYPSVSSVSAWVGKMHAAVSRDAADPTTRIIYLGDHDPDGLEIPWSAQRMIMAVQDVKGERFSFQVRPVALTMDQIEEYKPPPFGAKVSSSRFRRYVEETGTDDAWELDALEPRVLRQLVVDNVEACFDRDVWLRNEQHAIALRQEMQGRMLEPGWMERALRGESR